MTPCERLRPALQTKGILLAIPIPETIKVKRVEKSEKLLMEKSREWIETAERTPGIHASDLLDPRLAYWNRKNPQKHPDSLILTFLIGKVLHSFVLGAVDGKAPDLGTTDTGSKTSAELGIEYSVDHLLDGFPRELKSSRAMFEPDPEDLVEDLRAYIEQTLIYMVAEDKTYGEIWVLYLSLRNSKGRTAPAYRCYGITVTEKSLAILKKRMKATKGAIEKALDKGDWRELPICRRFKCGRGNCPHFELCKPEGRWVPPRKKKATAVKKARR